MTIDPKFVEMIKRGNFIVIDVETTGKEHYDVICEIAVINAVGETLLHTKVNPMRAISPEATRINGITDDDVKDAPKWPLVSIDVIDLMAGKDVIVWNEKHERMLFHRSDESAGCSHTEWKNFGFWWDAMTFYADVWGEPNEKYPNAKWQSLKNAMLQQGVETGLFHSALEDVRMTLALCLFIATKPSEVKTFAPAKPQPKPSEVTHDVKRVIVDCEQSYNEIARLLSIGYQIAGIVPAYNLHYTTTAKHNEVFLTRKF